MKHPLTIANGVMLASFLVVVAAMLAVLSCPWMPLRKTEPAEAAALFTPGAWTNAGMILPPAQK